MGARRRTGGRRSHFAYTLWSATALALAVLVRRRAAWLANLAGLLAVLAISSIPGFLMGDFIDSAMGQLVGVDAAVAVGEMANAQCQHRASRLPTLRGAQPAASTREVVAA